jgi:hypothetical protein
LHKVDNHVGPILAGGNQYVLIGTGQPNPWQAKKHENGK